jgi:hypothetical protein
MPAHSRIQDQTPFGQSLEESSILLLQRSIGNQAMQQLLMENTGNRHEDVGDSRISNFDRDFCRIPASPPNTVVIQTKLAINKPGDEYEQEADQMAQGVTNTSLPRPRHGEAGAGLDLL